MIMCQIVAPYAGVIRIRFKGFISAEAPLPMFSVQKCAINATRN